MLSAHLIRDGEEPVEWDMPRLRKTNRSKEEIRSRRWQCKFCHADMTPNLGQLRAWYFSHKPGHSPCPFDTESEAESPLHRDLKHAAANALYQHFKQDVDSLKYEVRFEDVGRIADALLTLKDGTLLAVEAQVSPITLEQVQERTHAYLRAGLEVVWVFVEHQSASAVPYAGQGRKAAPFWAECREWLLDEGFMVLNAKVTTTEKHLPLPEKEL